MTTGGLVVDELESVGRAIDALEAQRSTLGDAVVDLALGPLLERRRRLADGAIGEQRKQVTVLFSDLVDFTVLSRTLDAEDVRSIMGEYFSVWARCIEAEGGEVEKYIGDAVMAVFGLRRAREDDPHRAVRSALAMVEALPGLNRHIGERHGVHLQMRVGIDTGDVVVAALGDRPATDPVVVGEIVNRAARLQAEAPPGGVLLSADTCLHVRGSFALQGVGGLELKGIAEPVEAYLALGAGTSGFWPEARGVEGVVTRTIGRQLELGWLQRAFDDVAGTAGDGGGGSGRLVVATILGHAGIGKSRLVRDFEAWLAGLPDDVRLLRGRATPTTEAVPGGLLRAVFAERLGIAAGDPPEEVRRTWESAPGRFGTDGDGSSEALVLARWLGFAIGDDVHLDGLAFDPEGLRTQGRAILATHLRALSMATPTVVLLEDLHWSDDVTLEWLTGLGDELADCPLLIVATTRPSLLERRPHWGEGLDAHTVLRLEPLSRRDRVRLVDEILQRAEAVPAQVVDVVVGASDGNPFYIEELISWMVGEGVVDTSGDRWVVTAADLDLGRVPATLKAVIQARLDALPATERAVAQRASVVGRVFWDAAVRHLDPGSADVGDALVGLRSREVMFRHDRSAFAGVAEYSFRHALLRDVAYESVLRSTRRTLHARVADWLERVADDTGRGDEYAATIAQHHAEAGQASQAARWYLRAGRRAASVFANTEALELLDRARHLAPADEPGLGVEVMLAIESVLDRIGDRPAQRAVLDALATADDASSPLRSATIRLAESRFAFFHGDYPRSTAFAAEAAALARRAGSGRVEAEALIRQGTSLAWSGAHTEAGEILVAAQQRAEAAGEEGLVGTSLRFQAVVATIGGDHAGALELLGPARDLHRRHHDLHQESQDVTQLAVALEAMGRLEEARATYGEGLAMAERLGYRFSQAMIIGNLAGIAAAQGRLGEARRAAARSLAMCEELGDVEGRAEMHLVLGEVARLAGDHATADALLGTAVDLGRPIDADAIVVKALTARALVAADDGRPGQARRLAEDADAIGRRSGIPAARARAALAAGLVRLDAGDPDGAAAALGPARTDFERLGIAAGMAECDAAVALAAARAGHPAEAAASVADLLGRIEQTGLDGCLDPGRALLACHDVLAETGDERLERVRSLIRAHLDGRARLIDDDELRLGFLTRAPVNVVLAERSHPVGRALSPGPNA